MAEENLENQEKKERRNIKAGIVLTYLRLAVYIVISIIYPPRLVSFLTPETYNIYQFAISIATWVLLLSFGIENSYVRFATEAEQKGGAESLKKTNGFYLIIFTIISLLELIVGLLVAFLYRSQAISLSNYDETKRNLLSILIAVTVINESADFLMSFFTWFIYYKGEFIWEQSIFLLVRVLTVGTTLGALFSGVDVVAVALISLCVQLALDIANVLYAFFRLHIHFSFPHPSEFRGMLKEVIVFSFFLFLIVIVNQVNSNIGKTVLGHLDSEDQSAVTVFSFGIQFFEYESLIATAITTNFAPKVNRLAITHDDEQVKSYFLRVSNIQMIILFMIVGGFAICGLDFVHAWLADSTLTSANLNNVYYIALCVLAMWIIPFSETLGIEIQKAYNKHKFLAISNLLFALVNIGVTIGILFALPSNLKIFAPIIGMAVAVFGGNIIVTNIYYKKEMKLPVGRFFIEFVILLALTVVDCAVVYTVYAYGVRLPADWNEWVVTLIKGFSFLLLYLPEIFLLFHKQIQGYLANLKNAHCSAK
jgi:O-antigen/teichoic acid export membrane protein